MLNIEKETTKALEDNGAFYAFSNDQLHEKAIQGVKYVGLGNGLICPENNAQALSNALNEAINQGVEKVLETKSKREIIWYELANHECQITYDYSDAATALEIYEITEEEVKEVWPDFIKHCQDNDLF